MSDVATIAKSLTKAMRQAFIEDGGSKRTVRKLFDMGFASSVRYHGSFAIVRRWSQDALTVRAYIKSTKPKAGDA